MIILLPSTSDMCRWQVEDKDEDVEVVPQGDSQPSPIFYQQAFMEAMGAAFTSIAQASAAGDQGGLNNLQRFKAHHPPTFMRGDLMVVDNWFRQIEKILEAMEITSDAIKIKLATF